MSASSLLCAARRAVAASVLSLFAVPVLALPPTSPGEPVRSIQNADRIRDWSTLDNQRVVVSVDARDAYLLTLKHQCHALSWARSVTVTMSNNTIWAGFDAIKADGLQCPIEHISKVSARELLELQRR